MTSSSTDEVGCECLTEFRAQRCTTYPVEFARSAKPDDQWIRKGKFPAIAVLVAVLPREDFLYILLTSMRFFISLGVARVLDWATRLKYYDRRSIL